MSESGPSCRSSKELGSARSALIAGFARIELMTPSELLDLAWSYPLFEALYGPALAAVRPRLRDAGGALPLQVRAHAGPPERDRGSAAGRRGRRILRTGALGSADAGALPSPQRPHIPDDATWRPHGTFFSPTMKGSMSSMPNVAASKTARDREPRREGQAPRSVPRAASGASPWPARHSAPYTADERPRPLGFEPAGLDAVFCRYAM